MGLARFGALPADGAEAGRPDRKAAFGRSPPCVPGTGSGMAHRVDANSREGAREAGRTYAFLHGCQPYWAAQDKGLESRWYLYCVDY